MMKSPRSGSSPVLNAGSRDKVRRAAEGFSRIARPRARLAAQHLVQTGPGIGPVAVGGPPRQAERHRRLVEGQAGEETELDQLRTRRAFLGQALEGLVDGH